MTSNPYRVQIELFEGPLDLLLHLIKTNEVDVTNIPVATITEQYLAYLDLMRDLSLDIAGEYLVMAATLTLLKSRLLLPSPEPDDEEEADPRADLVRQLLEYQRYREAAAALGERPLLHRDVFTREPSDEGVPADDAPLPVKVTLWELMDAFRAVLRRAQPDPVHQVEAEPVTLRDRITGLLRTLGVARSVTFDSLFGDAPTRGFVIVTFLAVLELAKLGAVQAVQAEALGPILIVLAVDDVRDVTIDLLDEYEGTPAIGGAPAADD
jgi:segregation and condensation protein A